MTTELIQTLDRYCKSQILYASTTVALSVLYESVTGRIGNGPTATNGVWRVSVYCQKPLGAPALSWWVLGAVDCRRGSGWWT